MTDNELIEQETFKGSPEELNRLIKHLREKYPQRAIENIGGFHRGFPTDYCVAADYLEALRAELPHWQPNRTEGTDNG